MFRRQSSLHTLDTARDMIKHAIYIVNGYRHNKKYIPTEDEVEKFEIFEKEMWQHYCAARYIVRSMHQRTLGKPESKRKWFDKLMGEPEKLASDESNRED